jgi:hypothetical protein
MAATLPFPISLILVDVCTNHQHEICWKFNWVTVQGITSPLYCLKIPNQTGAPNAARRHTPPDLSSRTISMRTKRSTMCLSFVSIFFVLKLFRESLCTTRANHAKISPKFKFIMMVRRLLLSIDHFLLPVDPPQLCLSPGHGGSVSLHYLLRSRSFIRWSGRPPRRCQRIP